MADVIGDIRGENPSVEVFDGRAWIPLSEGMNRQYIIDAEFIEEGRYVLESVGETKVSPDGRYSWTSYRMKFVPGKAIKAD